ncbi:AsmA-like C-terminal region-containing protein [Aureimonas populi]|uniref:AsmA-like C-terminal region-containing protein n=1 Tax=Aureimonas populi TaxID=1701758 RepID=A0ABW5CKG9_9HYPH|nr:AsmA-like C-terminal region-containing protein [Aureimonas populi]
MTRTLLRLGTGLFGLALALCIAVVCAGAFLLFSQTGQDLLRERTQAAIARLLGPAYQSDLGEQTVVMRPDGTLAIEWTGASVRRADEPDTITEVDRVALGIRLLPLVGGGIEFGRLEIEGARIDLSTFERLIISPPNAGGGEADERSTISRLSEGIVGLLERQIEALQALHFDTLAFREITIDGIPRLSGAFERARIDFAELRRSREGALSLSTGFSIGRLALSLGGDAAFDNGGKLASLSLRSGPVELRQVVPPAPITEVRDERPFGTDADLAVTLGVAREAQSGKLVSDLVLSTGPGALQAGRNRTRVDSAQLRLRHEAGADEVLLLPSPMRFAGTSFQLAGSLRPLGDGPQASGGLRFDLDASDLMSTVGQAEGENTRAHLSLEGFLDFARRRAELTQFALASGTGSLEGTGALDYSSPAGRVRLDLKALDLGAAAIKAFWPFNIGGGARRWSIANMGDEGRVREGSIAVDVRLDRFRPAFGPGAGPRPDELRMDLSIEDADFATVGALPRVYQVHGALRMRGGRTEIMAEDAMVAGYEAVVLAPSSVTFSRPQDTTARETDIDLSVDAVGDVSQLLAIADAAPIRALRAGPIEPGGARGTGRAVAKARLRIGEDIAPGDIVRGWSADAELMDVSLAEPLEGRRFSNLTGSLKLAPGLAESTLEGAMDEMPAKIALSIPFGAAAAQGRRIEIDLAVTAEKARAIAPALAGSLDGALSAKVTQDGTGTHLRLDLTDTRLSVPAVAWTKGPGVAATLDLEMEQADGLTHLRNMRLDGAGFAAAGSALLDAQGLRSAQLTDVTLNPGDNVSAEIERSGNGYSIEVKGARFDARPLLQSLQGALSQKPGARDPGRALDVSASIERVGGFNERVLENLSMNYTAHEGRLAALSLGGRLGSGPVRGDLAPSGEERAVRLTASDLGALLRFTGVYPHMEGGQGRLDLLGTDEAGYRGTFAISDFTLVDEPRLERIVGSEPVAGQGSLSQAVGRDLRTSRAYFDQASAALAYSGGTFQIGNGILRGPVFGSSFEGTLYDSQGRIAISGSFMPAYTVNRIFGAIPLVGQILGNGNEGGLLGITYRLSGAFASPTLTVNPISIIAPGIFRQIFEY